MGTSKLATRAASDGALLCIDLTQEVATAPLVSGSRGSALARLAAAGLPVASGFVVTHRAAQALLAEPGNEVVRSLADAWAVQHSRAAAPIRLTCSPRQRGGASGGSAVVTGPVALVDELCDLVGADVLAGRPVSPVLAVASPEPLWTVVARTAEGARRPEVELFGRRGRLDGVPARDEPGLPLRTRARVTSLARRAHTLLGQPVDLEVAVHDGGAEIEDCLLRSFVV